MTVGLALHRAETELRRADTALRRIGTIGAHWVLHGCNTMDRATNV